MAHDAPPQQEHEQGADPTVNEKDNLPASEGKEVLWTLICHEERQESHHRGLQSNFPGVSHAAPGEEEGVVLPGCGHSELHPPVIILLWLRSARHEPECPSNCHKQDQPVGPKGARKSDGGRAAPPPGVFVGVVHPTHQGLIPNEPLRMPHPEQTCMLFRGGTW